MSRVTYRMWKNLYERFKKMATDYRTSTLKIQVAPGVAENMNERTQLLEDMIPEMEEVEKQRRLERKKRS